MTQWKRLKYDLYLYFRYKLWQDLRNIKRRIWNKRLKLWWYQLFVRKNEFHRSLNTDFEAMIVMDEKKLKRYHEDLEKRRTIAHKRNLAREDG